MKERKACADEAKRLALKDANAWLDDKVMELHAKEKDVYAFHQWWHHLLRWGRKRTTGGRSFHGDDCQWRNGDNTGRGA